jgi:hypothetical protein
MACNPSDAPVLPLSQAMDTYGIDGGPNSDPRFLHNALAADTVGWSCGRIESASCAPAEHRAHVPGEVELCRALSTRFELELEGKYVGHGDEGSGTWAAFSAPLFAGGEEEALAAAEGPDALPNGPRLSSLTGGALWGPLTFRSSPLEDEVRRMQEELARGGEVDPNGADDELAPYRRLLDVVVRGAVEAGEVQAGGAIYLAPREGGVNVPPGDENHPVVYPHFILVRTRAGSYAGVVGLTVWT